MYAFTHKEHSEQPQEASTKKMALMKSKETIQLPLDSSGEKDSALVPSNPLSRLEYLHESDNSNTDKEAKLSHDHLELMTPSGNLFFVPMPSNHANTAEWIDV